MHANPILRSRPLAISMGEPAGVGPDIILAAHQALLNQGKSGLGGLVFGDVATFRERANALALPVDVIVAEPEEFDTQTASLQVVQAGQGLKTSPGKPAWDGVPGVLAALDAACSAVSKGVCSALVTAPIHKAHLYGAGFAFPGHTEFLEDFARTRSGAPSAKAVMMLAGPELKTVPVTVHQSLRAAISHLSVERIVQVGRIVHTDLQGRFALESPKLVFCGLNPHAGEDGTLGDEDARIIAPAIDQLVRAGVNAEGPFPADTLFHADARSNYDVAVCMYHDQALIPVKTLDFHNSVNVTLGLPFIRTSPDHGTALPLAGTGTASPASMLAAINMAHSMVAQDAAHSSTNARSA
ncbi:MAG: 4-hydroxythreonine-4-phosphate dehydrogenase PdxA [Pseudomonadota bacterium]